LIYNDAEKAEGEQEALGEDAETLVGREFADADFVQFGKNIGAIFGGEISAGYIGAVILLAVANILGEIAIRNKMHDMTDNSYNADDDPEMEGTSTSPTYSAPLYINPGFPETDDPQQTGSFWGRVFIRAASQALSSFVSESMTAMAKLEYKSQKSRQHESADSEFSGMPGAVAQLLTKDAAPVAEAKDEEPATTTIDVPNLVKVTIAEAKAEGKHAEVTEIETRDGKVLLVTTRPADGVKASVTQSGNDSPIITLSKGNAGISYTLDVDSQAEDSESSETRTSSPVYRITPRSVSIRSNEREPIATLRSEAEPTEGHGREGSYEVEGEGVRVDFAPGENGATTVTVAANDSASSETFEVSADTFTEEFFAVLAPTEDNSSMLAEAAVATQMPSSSSAPSLSDYREAGSSETAVEQRREARDDLRLQGRTDRIDAATPAERTEEMLAASWDKITDVSAEQVEDPAVISFVKALDAQDVTIVHAESKKDGQTYYIISFDDTTNLEAALATLEGGAVVSQRLGAITQGGDFTSLKEVFIVVSSDGNRLMNAKISSANLAEGTVEKAVATAIETPQADGTQLASSSDIQLSIDLDTGEVYGLFDVQDTGGFLQAGLGSDSTQVRQATAQIMTSLGFSPEGRSEDGQAEAIQQAAGMIEPGSMKIVTRRAENTEVVEARFKLSKAGQEKAASSMSWHSGEQGVADALMSAGVTDLVFGVSLADAAVSEQGVQKGEVFVREAQMSASQGREISEAAVERMLASLGVDEGVASAAAGEDESASGLQSIVKRLMNGDIKDSKQLLKEIQALGGAVAESAKKAQGEGKEFGDKEFDQIKADVVFSARLAQVVASIETGHIDDVSVRVVRNMDTTVGENERSTNKLTTTIIVSGTRECFDVDAEVSLDGKEAKPLSEYLPGLTGLESGAMVSFVVDIDEGSRETTVKWADTYMPDAGTFMDNVNSFTDDTAVAETGLVGRAVKLSTIFDRLKYDYTAIEGGKYLEVRLRDGSVATFRNALTIAPIMDGETTRLVAADGATLGEIETPEIEFTDPSGRVVKRPLSASIEYFEYNREGGRIVGFDGEAMLDASKMQGGGEAGDEAGVGERAKLTYLGECDSSRIVARGTGRASINANAGTFTAQGWSGNVVSEDGKKRYGAYNGKIVSDGDAVGAIAGANGRSSVEQKVKFTSSGELGFEFYHEGALVTRDNFEQVNTALGGSLKVDRGEYKALYKKLGIDGSAAEFKFQLSEGTEGTVVLAQAFSSTKTDFAVVYEAKSTMLIHYFSGAVTLYGSETKTQPGPGGKVVRGLTITQEGKGRIFLVNGSFSLEFDKKAGLFKLNSYSAIAVDRQVTDQRPENVALKTGKTSESEGGAKDFVNLSVNAAGFVVIEEGSMYTIEEGKLVLASGTTVINRGAAPITIAGTTLEANGIGLVSADGTLENTADVSFAVSTADNTLTAMLPFVLEGNAWVPSDLGREVMIDGNPYNVVSSEAGDGSTTYNLVEVVPMPSLLAPAEESPAAPAEEAPVLPAEEEAAAEFYETDDGTRIPIVPGMQNCAAYAVGVDGGSIAPQHIPDIIEGDGYGVVSRSEDYQVGDIVVYTMEGDDHPWHIAVITETGDSIDDVMIRHVPGVGDSERVDHISECYELEAGPYQVYHSGSRATAPETSTTATEAVGPVSGTEATAQLPSQIPVAVEPEKLPVAAPVAGVTPVAAMEGAVTTQTDHKAEAEAFSKGSVTEKTEVIAAAGTLTQVDVQVPGTEKTLRFEVEAELLESLGRDEAGFRESVQSAMTARAKATGQTPDELFGGIQSTKPIKVIILDTSHTLFENHIQDGFVGVNRSVFDLKGDGLDILVATGITHELRHESGVDSTEADEMMLAREDAAMSAVLMQSKGMTKPERSAFVANLKTIASGNYVDALQVYDAIISGQENISGPGMQQGIKVLFGDRYESILQVRGESGIQRYLVVGSAARGDILGPDGARTLLGRQLSKGLGAVSSGEADLDSLTLAVRLDNNLTTEEGYALLGKGNELVGVGSNIYGADGETQTGVYVDLRDAAEKDPSKQRRYIARESTDNATTEMKQFDFVYTNNGDKAPWSLRFGFGEIRSDEALNQLGLSGDAGKAFVKALRSADNLQTVLTTFSEEGDLTLYLTGDGFSARLQHAAAPERNAAHTLYIKSRDKKTLGADVALYNPAGERCAFVKLNGMDSTVVAGTIEGGFDSAYADADYQGKGFRFNPVRDKSGKIVRWQTAGNLLPKQVADLIAQEMTRSFDSSAEKGLSSAVKQARRSQPSFSQPLPGARQLREQIAAQLLGIDVDIRDFGTHVQFTIKDSTQNGFNATFGPDVSGKLSYHIEGITRPEKGRLTRRVYDYQPSGKDQSDDYGITRLSTIRETQSEDGSRKTEAAVAVYLGNQIGVNRSQLPDTIETTKASDERAPDGSLINLDKVTQGRHFSMQNGGYTLITESAQVTRRHTLSIKRDADGKLQRTEAVAYLDHAGKVIQPDAEEKRAVAIERLVTVDISTGQEHVIEGIAGYIEQRKDDNAPRLYVRVEKQGATIVRVTPEGGAGGGEVYRSDNSYELLPVKRMTRDGVTYKVEVLQLAKYYHHIDLRDDIVSQDLPVAKSPELERIRESLEAGTSALADDKVIELLQERAGIKEKVLRAMQVRLEKVGDTYLLVVPEVTGETPDSAVELRSMLIEKIRESLNGAAGLTGEAGADPFKLTGFGDGSEIQNSGFAIAWRRLTLPYMFLAPLNTVTESVCPVAWVASSGMRQAIAKPEF